MGSDSASCSCSHHQSALIDAVSPPLDCEQESILIQADQIKAVAEESVPAECVEDVAIETTAPSSHMERIRACLVELRDSDSLAAIRKMVATEMAHGLSCLAVIPACFARMVERRLSTAHVIQAIYLAWEELTMEQQAAFGSLTDASHPVWAMVSNYHAVLKPKKSGEDGSVDWLAERIESDNIYAEVIESLFLQVSDKSLLGTSKGDLHDFDRCRATVENMLISLRGYTRSTVALVIARLAWSAIFEYHNTYMVLAIVDSEYSESMALVSRLDAFYRRHANKDC